MLQRSSVHVLEEAPGERSGGEWAWGARFRAAGCHLGLSVVAATAVLVCIYLGWYRDPLDSISGVGEILLLLIAVDVTLGPLLTLLVFDRRKKSLPFDLAFIGVIQLAALLYGIVTVEAGRPHYLVFVKDRFEVVSRADLRTEDRDAASSNPSAEIAWFGPRTVAAELPPSLDERNRILFESVAGGRDLHHYPERYRDYASQAEIAAGRARPISELRQLNQDRGAILDEAVASAGLPEGRLGFLPVKGPSGDAAMLVDASSGNVVGMVNLRPWR